MVVLIGESASGKSTVEKVLCEKFGYERVISYTTRPMRNGEKDGVDYHYITEEEFRELASRGYFAETTNYRGWYYGAAKCDLTNNKVFVVEPNGFKQISAIPKLNIVSFYINVGRRDRLIKILQRGDDVDEAIRRNLSDIELFNGIGGKVNYEIPNNQYRLTPEEIAGTIDCLYKENLEA